MDNNPDAEGSKSGSIAHAGRVKKYKYIIAIVIVLLVAAVAYWHITQRNAQQAKLEQKGYTTTVNKVDGLEAHKQHKQAISLLEAFLKQKHPQDHRYHVLNMLAYIYELDGQHTKAVQTLQATEQAMPSGSRNAFLHASLASSYGDQGDKARAIAEYNKAISDAKIDNNYTTTPYISQWTLNIERLQAKK